VKKSFIFVAILALLVMLVPSCAPEGAPAPTPAEEWGIIEVRVTDPPPADVTSAVVTLTNIEIHREGSGWETISDAPPSFDLMTVIGVEEILGSENVMAGSFTQIRMDVTEVVVTIDEYPDPISAEVPSGKLKIVRPFKVEGGVKTVLTLDFNGEKSLILPGKDIETGKERALFKPVVKLLIEHEEEVGEGEQEREEEREREREEEHEGEEEKALEAIEEAEEELAEILAQVEQEGITLSTDAFAGFNALLAEAKSAFAAGNYEEAERLAEEAGEALSEIAEMIDSLEGDEEEEDGEAEEGEDEGEEEDEE